ncbi:hypothetical protein AsAng_0029450 [Aureispira anguillae]|uniref:Uncharacterized protein n=1 Tax=Aureispira anguillae TaxID=2864201 RepID=A0A915YFU4_9BACT|nr:hypothetical protein AsAng_0029450 [Aureispira anguillae]
MSLIGSFSFTYLSIFFSLIYYYNLFIGLMLVEIVIRMDWFILCTSQLIQLIINNFYFLFYIFLTNIFLLITILIPLFANNSPF